MIVTVDHPKCAILQTRTENFKIEEMPLAKDIAEQMFQCIQPYLPAAGLAAPQIGISKSIFIYSYDRDPKNFEVVINPTYQPIGTEMVSQWEGCFSVILSNTKWQIALVPRYEKILATFLNLEGRSVEKRLEGFAAKVFQHECDHLQGILNVARNDVVIKDFNTQEDLINFMQAVKRTDSERYTKPIQNH